MNEEINYIAKHYRKGKFSVAKGWRRLDIATAYKWRVLKVAVGVSSLIVLSVAAAVVYRQSVSERLPRETSERIITPAEQLTVSKTIDFENVPLSEVVERIKEVYGVELTGVPDNAEDYHLSLHYEGNVVDLVTTINEIIDTQMTVKE